MTPSQLAKESESSHQQAVFCWANMAARHGIEAADDERCYKEPGYAEQVYGTTDAIYELRWLHHIPNGGSRGDSEKSRMIRGAKLKAEGVKDGVLDIYLPAPKLVDQSDFETFGDHVTPKILGGFALVCGLYIEMKKPSERPVRATSKGGVRESQKEFINYAKTAGYVAVVCYTYVEAIGYLREYCKRGF